MGKRVAAIQSNYIPWKGYFDAINAVDEFILLDEVQFTRRDWRNRNKVKGAQGTQWLTIPVVVKGRYHQRIDETLVAEPDWAARHWRTVSHLYRRARCFDDVAAPLEAAYAAATSPRLSEINRGFIEAITSLLGIATPLRWSTEYEAAGTKGDRILELCLAAEADEYLSGPAARSYLDEEAFARKGVRVLWCDYEGYPEYPQLSEPFEHGVSILDLLCNTGGNAREHLKTFGGGSRGLC